MTGCRAIIGLVALYALLLQAFLGVLTPKGLEFEHGTVLCAPERSDAPVDHACDQHACCITVQAAGLIQAESSTFATIAWVDQRGIPASWPETENHAARAPPDHSASPRGPPSA